MKEAGKVCAGELSDSRARVVIRSVLTEPASREDRGPSREDRGSSREDRGFSREDRGSSREDPGHSREDDTVTQPRTNRILWKKSFLPKIRIKNTEERNSKTIVE